MHYALQSNHLHIISFNTHSTLLGYGHGGAWMRRGEIRSMQIWICSRSAVYAKTKHILLCPSKPGTDYWTSAHLRRIPPLIWSASPISHYFHSVGMLQIAALTWKDLYPILYAITTQNSIQKYAYQKPSGISISYSASIALHYVGRCIALRTLYTFHKPNQCQ